MIIRTASNNKENILKNISLQQNNLYEAYNKIQNNKKYENISENPIGSSDLVRINKQLAEIEAYAKNVEDARVQINAQDEIFSTIVDKMQRINDLAIQAANSPSGEAGFKACQIEIEELTKNIVALANTQYDGKYIFAGTNVKTQPFTLNDDGSITYSGTPNDHYAGYQRAYEVSDGVKVEINSAGDTIFGSYDPNDATKSSGLFKTLGELNEIMKGDMDNAAVREQLEGIQNSINHISEIQASHSITINKLDMSVELLENNELNLTSRKAALIEVDLPSAITELVQQNNALQASMQAYSKYPVNHYWIIFKKHLILPFIYFGRY